MPKCMMIRMIAVALFVSLSFSRGSHAAGLPGSLQDPGLYNALMTDAGRRDLADVVNRSREQLHDVMRRSLEAQHDEIRRVYKAIEERGLQAGVTLQFDLGLGASVSIDAKDIQQVIEWDKASPPTFPFKFKIEVKSEGSGVGHKGTTETTSDFLTSPEKGLAHFRDFRQAHR